jgi:copper oxidase (laccase) domain-containing protein
MAFEPRFFRMSKVKTTLTVIMRCRDRRVDAAAHVEVADHRHPARPAGCDEIVENFIDHRLMKRAFVAIGPEIELERFELDAEFIRHVVDSNRGEVGLAGFRADAGELWTLHINFIIALRARIGKGF